MADSLSPQHALIYVMVTMAAVDRAMTDEELKRIGDVVEGLPAFRDFDRDQLIPAAEACGEVLGADDGLTNVLAMVRESLSGRLRETAYALAVDVAAADLDIKREELRLLDMLRDALQLDKLTTAAIERGAQARHVSI
jgi:tellurite resistance protein